MAMPRRVQKKKKKEKSIKLDCGLVLGGILVLSTFILMLIGLFSPFLNLPKLTLVKEKVKSSPSVQEWVSTPPVGSGVPKWDNFGQEDTTVKLTEADLRQREVLRQLATNDRLIILDETGTMCDEFERMYPERIGTVRCLRIRADAEFLPTLPRHGDPKDSSCIPGTFSNQSITSNPMPDKMPFS